MKKNTGLILLLVLVFSSCGKQEVAKNEKDHFIDSLLAEMTLDEKIGQTVLYTSDWTSTGPTIRDSYKEDIKAGKVGAVFNAITTKYVRDLQHIAVEETRLGIPLIFGFDVIHGHRTIFPVPLGETASWDLEAIEQGARVAAIEASAEGLNWTFAPMVDIARDPRWGRIMEGAGEDPYLGSLVARARVRGFQGDDLSAPNTILACVKHYAAYGAAQAGREYHSVDMSERMLRSVYLPPYYAAVDEGVATVMTSFNDLDGVPATGNKFLLKKILRDEWGFNGFVVTDYTSINEMVNHGNVADLKEAASLALNAGVDMDMQGAAFDDYLKVLLEDGKVTEEQINLSARRILEMKYNLGLFDDPYLYCDEQREKELIYHPDHLKAARDMAKKSMVLLKNDNQVLPLSNKSEKLAVIGPLADSKKDLLGSWKGAGEDDRPVSILEAIRKIAGNQNIIYARGCDINSTDRSDFGKALYAAMVADKVIMIMGESSEMSGEAASRSNINLPGIQTELIKRISKTGKPLIIVLLNGRPLDLTEESQLADAILEAWFPGTEGGPAVAEILFGNSNPSGKLPVTFPRNLGQVPIYYSVKNTGRPMDPDQKYTSKYLDVPNTPLYPFGYGLSYTTFEYSEPQINDTILAPGSELEIKVKIKNTGEYDGEEVVQLYVRDLVGSVTRPLKELKGFSKIFIPKGEEREVVFHLKPEDLAFYRKNMSWGTELGEYILFTGGSSADTKEISFRLVK